MLEHSWGCEEAQGTPLHSTKRGTPSSGGEACREAAGSSTQAGPAQQQHTRSSCHGSLPSQAQGLRPTNNPSCSPGQTALWGGTQPLLHPARQGTAWQRHENGPGSAGVAPETAEGLCVGRCQITCLSPLLTAKAQRLSCIYLGVSSWLTVQLNATTQNIHPLINCCHLPGQSPDPWCPKKSVPNRLPGSPQL